MILNCITVDDEPLALNLINSFVERTPFLRLKASYSKASDAITGLQQPEIHLIFLDIQMPGVTGIEIARILHESTESFKPRVIFSTAHNQFAVESYQVEALDYLLKPFEYEDFLKTAQRAFQLFEKGLLQKTPSTEEALYVRIGYQQTKIQFNDIKYIQGQKDYAFIHLKSSSKPIMTLTTLKSLHSKLPQDRFIRVQKSFIVSIDSVTTVSSNNIRIDDTEISIGERFKTDVHAVLKKLF